MSVDSVTSIFGTQADKRKKTKHKTNKKNRRLPAVSRLKRSEQSAEVTGESQCF